MGRSDANPKRRLNLRKRTIEQAGPPAEATSGEISLTETLDRVLARGIVAQAEVVLTVADIPLVYVGLQALVSSVETARELLTDCGE
jgi:hypothetical protein